jgi:adenosine kinase
MGCRAYQTFALNLSAPFIPQFFGEQLSHSLAYCDIVIGNESEAEAWATATGQPDPKNITAIAKALTALPRLGSSRPRVVVITQGAQSTILVSSDEPENAKIFPVQVLTSDEIVDTNAAGDAFAGGFLGALVAGKSIDEAVIAGHKLAAICVKQVSDSPYS